MKPHCFNHWRVLSLISCKDTRSSRTEVFCKKGVLRNFAKLTGKYMYRSLFLIKLQTEACSFIKKETLT